MQCSLTISFDETVVSRQTQHGSPAGAIFMVRCKTRFLDQRARRMDLLLLDVLHIFKTSRPQNSFSVRCIALLDDGRCRYGQRRRRGH
jgi:hypothetical protein